MKFDLFVTHLDGSERRSLRSPYDSRDATHSTVRTTVLADMSVSDDQAAEVADAVVDAPLGMTVGSAHTRVKFRTEEAS